MNETQRKSALFFPGRGTISASFSICVCVCTPHDTVIAKTFVRDLVSYFAAESVKFIVAYGARHHNWPLFVIAAILLSDVARRQLRYRCKAGNESCPTPKTACACDVRLLNYAWHNADWLTGDLWSWLSANHQRLRCNGPNGHSDVAYSLFTYFGSSNFFWFLLHNESLWRNCFVQLMSCTSTFWKCVWFENMGSITKVMNMEVKNVPWKFCPFIAFGIVRWRVGKLDADFYPQLLKNRLLQPVYLLYIVTQLPAMLGGDRQVTSLTQLYAGPLKWRENNGAKMTSWSRKKFPVRVLKRNKTGQNHTPLLQELDFPDLSRKDDFDQLFNFQGPVISEFTIVTLRSCGVATRPAVDRDPKTRLRNAIAPACCPSVPFNMFKALVVLLNVLRAAITESPTQLAVVDLRSCGRDAPPKWNLPATTRLQQVGARSGMKIVYEPLLDGREATVVHAVPVSRQQTSSGQLQWSRWIGFQDRWCFSSVSFLCTRRAYVRRHFVPMVPPAVITIRMRTL